MCVRIWNCFFFQAEDGIRDVAVTGVQTCALPISSDFAGLRSPRLYGFHTGTGSLSNRKGRGRRRGGREREPRRAGEASPKPPPNLGVGCAPSCWPIFGFRTSWVLAGGAEGSFLCSLITDFLRS